MSGFWVMTLVLAELLPPARPGLVPPSLAVLDEQDRHQSLMTAGAATLLLPIFTRCAGTCPVTAASLKQALPGASGDFRVVLLSFDPRDTAAELQGFRKRLRSPFRVAPRALRRREVDPRAVRRSRVPRDEQRGGVQSPDQTFVFSPNGLWAATLSGPPSKEELSSAHGRALAADDGTPSRRLGAWLLRPEAWIVVACAGFGLSFAAVLLLARRTRAGSRSAQ